MKIAIIGECMVELFDQAEGQCRRGFGGDTLNTAIYMARCAAFSIDIHYVTILGDDSLSGEMLAQWQAEGIKTDMVEQISGAVPGIYMIQTNQQGERRFFYWRDQAPVKKLLQTAHGEHLLTQLLQFDWIYYSGISLAVLESAGREKLLDLLGCFRKQGGKVAFDMNYRPQLWQNNEAIRWITAAYQQCDVALPSLEDEGALWGEAEAAAIFQRLEHLGCREIILKRGGESCLVSFEGEHREYGVPPVMRIVDTTAAGDSFNAAYLARRMHGKSIPVAIKAGQHIAAQVISQQGAIVPIQS